MEGPLDNRRVKRLHRAMSDGPATVSRRSLLRQAGLSAVAVVAVQVALLSSVSPYAALMGAALFLGTLVLVLRHLPEGHPHERFGAANAVTLLRAGVASGLAGVMAEAGRLDDPGFAWAIVAVATASLALDGADGWLARRQGLASSFGARFDMEVDAGFALVLAMGLLLSGKAGFWVLLLGGLRYLFVAAAAVAPWLERPLPERQSRKTVCVIQIAALIALHAPAVVPPLSTLLAAGATTALVWSFAVDVVWLRRHR